MDRVGFFMQAVLSGLEKGLIKKKKKALGCLVGSFG